MEIAAVEMLLKMLHQVGNKWVAEWGQQDLRKWNTGYLSLFGRDLSQEVSAGWTWEEFNE